MEAWLEAEMKKAASLDRHDDGAGDKDWVSLHLSHVFSRICWSHFVF